MIRTNLSTRPFYNVRIVQTVIGGLALLVLAATLFDAIDVIRLSSSQRTVGASADAAEREAARLRAEAVRIRGQINPKELQTVANAAREANGIIDRRAFSWTELFAQFETTLPENVRITAVQPRLEKGVFTVSVALEARRVEDLNAFIDALEKTGTFKNVLATETQTDEAGLLEAIVEGNYQPPARTAASGAGAGAAPAAPSGAQP